MEESRIDEPSNDITIVDVQFCEPESLPVITETGHQNQQTADPHCEIMRSTIAKMLNCYVKLENLTSQEPEDELYRRKKGRPKKKNEKEIELQLAKDALNRSLITKCGKCEEQMPKSEWLSHSINRHNGMSWQDGKPVPDFNDSNFLRKILLKTCKMTGQLICESCGDVKRSALGFIVHLENCGKTDEQKIEELVMCEICNRAVKPMSLKMHMKYHRKTSSQYKFKVENLNFDEWEEELYEKKRGRPKMRDTSNKQKEELEENQLKGSVIIKCGKCNEEMPKCKWFPHSIYRHNGLAWQVGKPSPDFNDFKILRRVLVTACKIRNGRLTCEACGNERKSALGFISHLRNCRKREKETDKENEMQLVQRNGMDDFEPTSYTPAFQWTLAFQLGNYALRLFDAFQINPFLQLSEEEYLEYIPSADVSMATQTIKTHSELKSETGWKKWKRFEGGIANGTPVFFTGGPVWAIAWLPIPSPMAFVQSPDQFLAVSTHRSMDDEFIIGQSHSGRNIIQIWKLGRLDNTSQYEAIPEFSFAITHEFGTSWCLEWCPSGCYQDAHLFNLDKQFTGLKRMGLLAAACSDGNVYIFDIPNPSDLPIAEIKSRNQIPIFRTEPIMKLIVSSDVLEETKQNWQCTKISWTKEKDHGTIVAGFTNGYIALWHLQSNSPLLRSGKNNTTVIQSYTHFFAHQQPVTMVAFLPYANHRYIASASLDQFFKCWDLEDTSAPIKIDESGPATDGALLTHWGCVIVGYDDSLLLNHTYSKIITICEPNEPFSILPTNSSIYSVSACDFSNGLAHGNVAGEILVTFPYRVMPLCDIKRYSQCHVASSIQTIDLAESAENVQSSDYTKECLRSDQYAACKDRFGIVFYDNEMLQCSNTSEANVISNEMLKSIDKEQYPFSSVNRVSWNPNSWSYLYLAAGYHNGLVRLQSFKCKAPPEEYGKLLKSHSDDLLRK